jgi:hypothetical protein
MNGDSNARSIWLPGNAAWWQPGGCRKAANRRQRSANIQPNRDHAASGVCRDMNQPYRARHKLSSTRLSHAFMESALPDVGDCRPLGANT